MYAHRKGQSHVTTHKAKPQAGEQLTLPLFLCGPDKPMMEMEANSGVYFQAHVLKESLNEVKVLFPGGCVLLSGPPVAVRGGAEICGWGPHYPICNGTVAGTTCMPLVVILCDPTLLVLLATQPQWQKCLWHVCCQQQ